MKKKNQSRVIANAYFIFRNEILSGKDLLNQLNENPLDMLRLAEGFSIHYPVGFLTCEHHPEHPHSIFRKTTETDMNGGPLYSTPSGLVMYHDLLLNKHTCPLYDEAEMNKIEGQLETFKGQKAEANGSFDDMMNDVLSELSKRSDRKRPELNINAEEGWMKISDKTIEEDEQEGGMMMRVHKGDIIFDEKTNKVRTDIRKGSHMRVKDAKGLIFFKNETAFNNYIVKNEINIKEEESVNV